MGLATQPRHQMVHARAAAPCAHLLPLLLLASTGSVAGEYYSEYSFVAKWRGVHATVDVQHGLVATVDAIAVGVRDGQRDHTREVPAPLLRAAPALAQDRNIVRGQPPAVRDGLVRCEHHSNELRASARCTVHRRRRSPSPQYDAFGDSDLSRCFIRSDAGRGPDARSMSTARLRIPARIAEIDAGRGPDGRPSANPAIR
eukprot:COSAG03_NODE_2821_length_2432_cov_2.468495_1_plen_199_part_10